MPRWVINISGKDVVLLKVVRAETGVRPMHVMEWSDQRLKKALTKESARMGCLSVLDSI